MISERQRDKLPKIHHATLADLSQGEPFMRWSDWVEITKEEERSDLCDQIYEIFSERLMIGLSLILIPVLMLPILIQLPLSLILSLNTIDFVILFIFVMEYAFKLAVADDKKGFIFSTGHILDLFIILVPSVGLVLGIGYAQGRFLRLLRLLRLTQVATLGSRAYHRQSALRSATHESSSILHPLKIRSVSLDKREKGDKPNKEYYGDKGDKVDEDNMRSTWTNARFDSLINNEGRSEMWHDVSSISDRDIPELSRLFGAAFYIIRSKLSRRAYPQAERSGRLSIIFTKIPQLTQDPLDERKVYLNWEGLLYVNDDGGVTTLSQSEISSLTQVPEKARSEGFPLTPPVILYVIMHDSLCVVEELIFTAEEELMAFESLALRRLPSKFLFAVSKMRKETGIIISWLIHLKEVLIQIEAQNVPLHDWCEEDHARFKGLLDRCSYLNDAASNTNDNLSDLIDFYINSTSFQMNRVMKVLAVMTALTIFPAVVGGLLGTNILGNPWEITLAQLITLVVMAMMATGWTYYKLGWLR